MEIHSRFPIVLAGFMVSFAVSFPVLAHDVRGTVRLAPPYPQTEKIQVEEKYRRTCSDEQISKSLIVSSDGFIKNAVVFLDGDFESENTVRIETAVPVLDQKDCNFEPHILVVRPGRHFLIANSDPMAHDVRAFDGAKMLYRFEMDPFGKSVEKKFERPGIYVVRCGLHPWMHAFVVTAEHSFYAVSNERGEFELRGIPDGAYKLRIWHETLGEAEVPLEVQQSILDFSYTFKSR